MKKKRFSCASIKKKEEITYCQIHLLFKFRQEDLAVVQWFHPAGSYYSIPSFQKTNNFDIIPISTFIDSSYFHQSSMHENVYYLNKFIKTLK